MEIQHPTTLTDSADRATAIEVRDLTLERGGRTILNGIELHIARGELVVIAGASGSGKSTLLEALGGRRTPTRGTIRRSSSRTGFVPQDDLLHLHLPLGRSLTHAAALTVREPASSRARRVEEILATLDLADRRTVAVGDLSGGQRKRASIAVELLGEPDVVLLDEPTSGLDPATAADVIGALRRLARAGVTVVLTSHHADDLLSADRVLFLSPNGTVAFDGAPDGAAARFGVETIADVYLRLDRTDHDPAHTEPPHRGGEHRSQAVDPPTLRRAGARTDAAGGPDRPDRPGGLRQLRVLAQRNLEVLVRSRLTLAILLGAPVLIVAMMATLFPGDIASRGASHPLVPQLTFWMAFAAFFFGLTFGLLQIVDEVPILRREHRSGVGLVPYIASKVVTLLPVLVGVVLLLVGVLRAIGRLPGSSAPDLVAVLVIEAFAALALGLLASALVRTAAQAALALPMLCFPQVLFAGAVVPVDEMPGAGRALSLVLANRWGFEATGSLVDGGPSSWGPVVILGAIAAACSITTLAALRRRCRPS